MLSILHYDFFVIRSLANVAFAAVYVHLASKEQKSTARGVTTAALAAIQSVFVFATPVVIGFEQDWSLEKSVVPGFDAHRWGNQHAIATDRFEKMGKLFFGSYMGKGN